MYLYRPVGLFEYRLIENTDFQAFPPRLYWQPILITTLILAVQMGLIRLFHFGMQALASRYLKIKMGKSNFQ